MRTIAFAFVLAALFPAPAVAGSTIDRAVAALREDEVYVDPAAERRISGEDADRIRERIDGSSAGPVYVAILPAKAATEAGGSTDEAAAELIRALRRDGTYAVVVGNRLRATSTVIDGGDAGRLATEAIQEHRAEGVTPTLLAFVDAVSAARSGGEEGGGDGRGLAPIVLPLLAVGGIGFFLFRRRRRRAEDAELAGVKAAAQEDLLALADDIRRLDLDVELPGASEDARRDYERALSMYEKADRALDRARMPEELVEVSSAVADGRYAIAAAQARLEGRHPPDRRPPCFIDPRHGPSAREVEWAPPWGAPRPIPVCEADAQRIVQGLEPVPRQVTVGGRRTPYWDAPPAYGPWAGGFFGGFGGLFPGLFFGSLLGSALAPPVYIDTGDGGDGDSGADGGFGGGDFGGGDFGGGDFGGGDF
ncbi:MAG: hypothetical protein M3327_00240 [Actinomycetota bacterium]|nr:hypothetical protein [Actinomycetota bacterium]